MHWTEDFPTVVLIVVVGRGRGKFELTITKFRLKQTRHSAHLCFILPLPYHICPFSVLFEKQKTKLPSDTVWMWYQRTCTIYVHGMLFRYWDKHQHFFLPNHKWLQCYQHRREHRLNNKKYIIRASWKQYVLLETVM